MSERHFLDTLPHDSIGWVQEQLQHLAWHGDDLHHWHAGITALDGDGARTEDITEFYGVPVYRMLDLPREALRAIPLSRSSCHLRVEAA